MADKRTIKRRRAKLISALRSGKYKQRKGNLGTHNEPNADDFCCLGVACIVAGIKPVLQKSGFYHFLGEETQLPRLIREYYGFASGDGDYIDSRKRKQCLVKDNDNRNWSFKMIANVIEREPKGLFVN